MVELWEFLKEVFGDIAASGICKGLAPMYRYGKPYFSAVAVKARGPIIAFWSDFKPVLRNPLGALLMTLLVVTLAIGVWENIAYPAEAPLLLQSALGSLWFGYLMYFAWRGCKALFTKARLATFR